jgi:hypothetical protein
MADIGCTTEQIKAFGGWKSDASVAPYLKMVNQQRLAQQAMAQLQHKTGSTVVQHPAMLDRNRG